MIFVFYFYFSPHIVSTAFISNIPILLLSSSWKASVLYSFNYPTPTFLKRMICLLLLVIHFGKNKSIRLFDVFQKWYLQWSPNKFIPKVARKFYLLLVWKFLQFLLTAVKSWSIWKIHQLIFNHLLNSLLCDEF